MEILVEHIAAGLPTNADTFPEIELLRALTSISPAGPSPTAHPAESVSLRRSSWRPASATSFAKPLSELEVFRLIESAYGHVGSRPCPSAGSMYRLSFVVSQPYGSSRSCDSGHITFLGELGREQILKALFTTFGCQATVLWICADIQHIAQRYGPRAFRYSLLEIGHVAQEMIRACAEVRVSIRPVGAFCDDLMSELLGEHGIDTTPLYAMMLGSKC
jgi:hypothetical protein